MLNKNLEIMTTITKNTVKRLVANIDSVLFLNSYRNEMGLLMSRGENFGQVTEPDFTEVVINWHLTRESLSKCIDLARKYGQMFFDNFPKEKIKMHPWGRTNVEEINYWSEAEQSLHCIFMTGIL